MDDIDSHIGRQLLRRRRRMGLTQKEVADVCGLRFQQIQKYEAAASRVSAARLWQLAEILEVSVGYFFEGFKLNQNAVSEVNGSKETKDLFEAYRALGEKPRRALVGLAKAMAEKH